MDDIFRYKQVLELEGLDGSYLGFVQMQVSRLKLTTHLSLDIHGLVVPTKHIVAATHDSLLTLACETAAARSGTSIHLQVQHSAHAGLDVDAASAEPMAGVFK